MNKLLTAEFMKIQWRLIAVLILIALIADVSLASSNWGMLSAVYEPSWPNYLMYIINLHTAFFFPLLSGTIAGLICLYEHRSGGWKQLLATPYSRSSIYSAKYAVLLCMLAIIQVLFIAAEIGSGMIAGVEGPVDWLFVVSSAVLGWFGILPLAAIQLWFSSRFKNFGIAFSINVVCVLLNIVFSGLPSTLGMWFPFVLPFYTMMPQGTPFSPRVQEWSLYAMVGISFVFYFLLGKYMFRRKQLGA
ncbi:multidrug ABC transporter permease [Paenibacillus antibioticophila]|uniref:Multidrug ABC transporter permease n=1 Tax=Paenibacillus antibioticophila TaxID=1274374 RepID=A0A920CHC7_9BACL|nr:ABC transporter permease [Paenibacillus antibioticophila]GIO37029.1 multidrug ABC transporter permease [Paenibacillus antibioticophila]